jgi:trehalose 6-phosphate synthase/phosphatase
MASGLPRQAFSLDSATLSTGTASVGKRPPLPSTFRPEKRGRPDDDSDRQTHGGSAEEPSPTAQPPPPRTPTLERSNSSGTGGNLQHLASWRSTSSSQDGDVNTGTYTRVHLKVKAGSRLGESVHCSGSSFVMGHFNPNESMTLVTTPEDYPYWSTVKPMILPRGVPHQYMYALFSGGVFSSWEPIGCERVLVPDGREMTVIEDYGDYDPEAGLFPTGELIDRSAVFERRREDVDLEAPRSDISEADEAEPKEDSSRSSSRCEGSVDTDAELEHTPTRMSRSASQHFKQNAKLQSRYKRYLPSNYHPDPEATLFLVCYHLPVILTKSDADGSWSAEWNRDSLISRSEGSIAESMKTTWVGCVTHHARHDQEELSEEDKVEITMVLEAMHCIPVFIDREMANNHHLGYCKNKLWPMFHNVDILDIYYAIWDRSDMIEWKEERNNGEWWEAYQTVNQLLAARVGELCSSKDTVWVHDYHLLLFPSYLANISEAKQVRRPKMVFFLHVPFPTSEIFREMSHGTQLLEGVLAVDVVGFHSFDHARHFLNACKRFLGLAYQSRRGGNLGVDYRGRNVVITISHVGIETEYIRSLIAKPEVQEAARKLREKHPGKVLIAGIDICQRLSGIPLKLLAFEQFFNNCPAWKDKAVMVQRSSMTEARQGDQKYSSEEIRKLVHRITSQHGPDVVDYEEISGPISFKDRLALWMACDILMVTSIREGLNLKPLEFVYTKSVHNPGRPGVVILSEFSACCCVLNGALRVNPWNITEVVNSLDHALTMSEEERKGRRARDLPYITNQPAANWTKQVLSVLEEATELDVEDEEYTDMEYMDMEIGRSHVLRIGQRSDFKQLNVSKVMEAYQGSRRRVFLLDYGGTIIARENISMYVKKDFTAVTGKLPSKRMLDALSMITSDPRNTVYVVSGVSRLNLTAAIGHIKGLGLVSDNGALYSWANSIHADTVEEAAVRAGDDSGELKDERHWHRHAFSFDWRPIREVVDPILNMYCTRTNGSVLRHTEQGIAWNFRSTDPEWGLVQANSLHQDLEEVVRDFPVNIVRKKGLLEIAPEGLNKGVVARQILAHDAATHSGRHPDFLFCIGDDTTDESMFKAIFDYYAERTEESVHGRVLAEPTAGATLLANQFGGDLDSLDEGALHHVFTCTVGKKPSNAHLYVNNVDDVEQLLFTLGETSAGEVRSPIPRAKRSKRH